MGMISTFANVCEIDIWLLLFGVWLLLFFGGG